MTVHYAKSPVAEFKEEQKVFDIDKRTSYLNDFVKYYDSGNNKNSLLKLEKIEDESTPTKDDISNSNYSQRYNKTFEDSEHPVEKLQMNIGDTIHQDEYRSHLK